MVRISKWLYSLADIVPQGIVNKTFSTQKLSVFYHAVSAQDLLHTNNLYKTKTPQQFEADLDYLLLNYKEKLQLSFDDGLSCCYHTIAPILKKKGVQAHFFINPSFINNAALFYRYKVALLINKCTLHKPTFNAFANRVKANPVEYLFNITYAEQNILNELASIAEISFDDYLKQHQPYLTEQEVNSLVNDGFLIGAHSMDHPPFYQISFDEQVKQVVESINYVRTVFNINYAHFSFPFTDWGISKKLFDYLYLNKLVDATWGCAGLKHDSRNPLHQQRIALDLIATNAQQHIKKEWLYYQLKSIINKNTINTF